jgi:phage-related protein (TIGR01555 family)
MFTTHMLGSAGFGQTMLEALSAKVRRAIPAPAGVAMDSSNGSSTFSLSAMEGLPDALVGWYASQTFIGYQMCAIVAQHWLVDKACTMPARDAIRHGFDIHVDVEGLEEEQTQEIEEQFAEQDKFFRLAWNMEQFIKMGRVFGVRVAFFKVESPDPKYYEKPFNPDGIVAGSYRGVVQVDPYWCIPMLDGEAASDPASPNFYEPTWWVINGQKYHRSHLCIFRNCEVPDVFKPLYQYGGISVPQKIMERVYAAERTANEGPQLAMTKRTLVWNTDVSAILGNQTKFAEHMQTWNALRDNYGIKINDTEDTMQQFDTALSDLDETIMTQYQLVAAGANVPATKLLGTTPKGFNSTGEYEESSYHEELETIQANDLNAFVERHHMMVARSIIEPENNLAPGTLTVRIDWAPVDSPTAKEYAEINKLNAETDGLLVTAGAIDGMDVRARIKSDPNSGFTGLADVNPADDLPDETDGKTVTQLVDEVLNGPPPAPTTI